jgi:hypothetical protein
MYLVARMEGVTPVDPQIVSINATSVPLAAARKYEGLRPGMKVAVWSLGNNSQAYVAGEDMNVMHPVEKGVQA